MRAILTDVARCTGCQKCVAACTAEHGLPAAAAPQPWTLDDGISADRFTSVVRRGGAHVRKHCRHCLEPACAAACPVGALRKTAAGPVTYDASRCLGCRYCMMACPFGIPRYTWASAAPAVRKCTMCWERRLAQGGQPACTEACPAHATEFGEREELLEEAHRRLRQSPSTYQQRVWGEGDAGGSAVLYISNVSLDFLGIGGGVPAAPLPRLTATAMAAVPPVFLGVGAVMASLRWIIGRRRKLASGEDPERTGEGPGPDGGKP